MKFDQAFDQLIGHEGGFVDDPKDPGGRTKYGISQRQYPALNIAALTLDEAKRIYQRDYWGPAGCDAVPDGIKFDLFDMAVNSGIKAAARTLQKAVGEVPDGVIGPRTLQAINSMPAPRIVARFNGHRLQYLTEIGTWERFGKGWARRIAQNLQFA